MMGQGADVTEIPTPCSASPYVLKLYLWCVLMHVEMFFRSANEEVVTKCGKCSSLKSCSVI